MSEINSNIVLSNAKEINISGVTDAISATETAININTVLGGLLIKGKKLHVEKLDLEQQILVATGTIEELKYVQAKKSFIKRLFK